MSVAEYVLSIPEYQGWMGKAVKEPMWEGTVKVHDWRNYIPYSIRQIWNELTIEARIVAIVMAHTQATNEEWD